jgi:hypothetical protein
MFERIGFRLFYLIWEQFFWEKAWLKIQGDDVWGRQRGDGGRSGSYNSHYYKG